ncbi:MAG: glycosyltransferase family 9 protein [Janthinobacterium lividum]
MIKSLLARIRLSYRQQRQQRQLAMLSRLDAQALATQAVPRPTEVLVVRNDSIGDYLLYRSWLRQFHAVVRARGQRLTLLANALWAPLAEAWDSDCYEVIIAVEFGRFANDLAYRAEILQRIGKQGFGEVIYPLHVREPAVENFIRFLQAPVRVASEGAHQVSSWFSILNTGYSQVLPSARAILFEYYRNQEFFENWRQLVPAASPLVTAELPALELPQSVQEATANTGAADPYIVLFPGASARQKQWPVQHFAQLAQFLHGHYAGQYRFVIAGSAADNALAQQLIQSAGLPLPFDNRCGQTSLPELAALLAGARLLISNDTVAAHLAVQAGTACLVLLMGENYGKFFPYPPALLRGPCQCLFPPSQELRFGQGDFSPPAQDPDIASIEPRRVAIAAMELLRGSKAKQ